MTLSPFPFFDTSYQAVLDFAQSSQSESVLLKTSLFQVYGTLIDVQKNESFETNN